MSNTNPPSSLSGITRRKISAYILGMDGHWSGGLSEVDFLGRLYKLEELPTNDYRFESAAGDIYQHRENNQDWEDDWVFKDERFLLNCTDEAFLAFVCEVLHPEVRSDISQEPPLALKEVNKILAPDGYQLMAINYVSGHAIYGWFQTQGFHNKKGVVGLSKKTSMANREVLNQHFRRIEEGLVRDPAMAVSSCKELLESLFKILLTQHSVAFSDSRDDFTALYKKVAKLLGIDKDSVEGSKQGSQASYKVIGSLAGSVQGLTELRNAIGLGHGKVEANMAFERHARLAFNSTIALAEFILDTREYRIQTGKIKD